MSPLSEAKSAVWFLLPLSLPYRLRNHGQPFDKKYSINETLQQRCLSFQHTAKVKVRELVTITMRFINTSTLQFQDVGDLELSDLSPGYCILSHRWTDDEIQYTDVLSSSADTQRKTGYRKFAGACALAASLGYALIWIDACCINKTDSVELGEAINSMYRWYSESSLCIAYLQDVVTPEQLSESEWFDRGWTLQELLAPTHVRFYGQDWNVLGDKESMHEVLRHRTNIPSKILQGREHPRACSVAQRMSWAAKRITKRVEDRAYSLMGLFDVNMPMIYGERDRAFFRLQEQIIAKSADETIFAWDMAVVKGSQDEKLVFAGLLAPSPDCFIRSGVIVSTGQSSGFSIDQFGLSISLPATLSAIGTHCATLSAADSNGKRCAILLRELAWDGLCARVTSPTGQSLLQAKPASQTASFTTPLWPPMKPPVDMYPGFWIRRMEIIRPHLHNVHAFSRNPAAGKEHLMLPDGEFGTAGIILIHPIPNSPHASCWLRFGFEPQHCRPICSVALLWSDMNPNAPAVKQMLNQAASLQSGDHYGAREQLSIFSDRWIDSDGRGMNWYQDSRYGPNSYTQEDGGIRLRFQSPFIALDIFVTRVADIKATGPRTGEIWAIEVAISGADTNGGESTSNESVCGSCWSLC